MDKEQEPSNATAAPSAENGASSEPISFIPQSTPLDATSVPPDVPKEERHINMKFFSALILAIVLLAGSVFFYHTKEKHVAVKQFTNVYSFVPEKISKSAYIPVSVPEGIDEETARNSITFSPEVKGTWQTEELEDVVVFAPEKPLKSGVYYAVNMDTGSVQMSGDFFVDEDPKIEAVFPAADNETHEDSEITIVFNRPMVPLTTLTEQESIEIPITITPETPGRFKWISTRNLQFIPETTLIPSSDYTVEIGEGLYSVDGLPVAPMTHKFVTRPLRYLTSDGTSYHNYRSPIVIPFNQAVDLEKTASKISVTHHEDGSAVAVDFEYGKTRTYNRKEKKWEEVENKSQIHIYQKKDQHGRKHFWDFETNYDVSINGAIPLQGNKDLTEVKSLFVEIPHIVRSVDAESDRSEYVSTRMFDPEGTLTVSFYDDIDLSASDIEVKGLRGIRYAERCKTGEDGTEVRVGEGCEKENDPQKIILSFHQDQFGKGEEFTIYFKKLVHPDGFRINTDTITWSVTTYPEFKIHNLVNDRNGKSGPDLDGIYVCTNTPLSDPGEEGLSSYISTDGYIVFGNWSRSRMEASGGPGKPCDQWEYETHIRYGLLPETAYELSFTLTDDFDQKAGIRTNFVTEAPGAIYTRFHNLQQQYNVTVPERTKLTYAVENLEYVNMHICKLSPEDFLKRVYDRPGETTPPSSAGCTEVKTEKILLPSRYWVNNYFQVDLAKYFADTRGHYVLTFSNPLYTAYYEGQAYDRTYVSVTNLAVGKKEVDYSDRQESNNTHPGGPELVSDAMSANQNLYWVNNSKTLAPVVGATVTQYDYTKGETPTQQGIGFTDAQGVARAPIGEKVVGAVVRAGADTAVVTGWSDRLQYAGTARDASRTYIYTDRPIYRPGHTVHIRGIDRIGYDGSYETIAGETAPLEVLDARGTSIYKTDLFMSEYGTFDTSFTIPEDATLGNYRIKVFKNSAYFSVEEYQPAPFKLEAESEKEEYMQGDTMKIDVQGDYYFGVPLTDGTVSYSVTAQDYYFNKYTDEYFNFGGGWYYCYSCGYGDDFLFRGEIDLDENGHGVIERKLSYDDFFNDPDEEKSKIVTVFMVAKDMNGRSVSMQKSFVLHKGDFYMGAKTDRYFAQVNTPTGLRVKTVDVEGTPMAVSDIDKKVFKVSWETFKRQEVDGGFYYRSEKKLDEISQEKIKTDRDGNWMGEVTFGEEGQYEIHLSARDDRDNLIKTVNTLYVHGSRNVYVPPSNNYELDLEYERTDYEVGETAKLLIKSPYDNAKALITAERGTIQDYWIVDVDNGLYEHEFPIKESYAPNIYLSALLFSDDPEVKHGQVRYSIGTNKNDLVVDVTANKTHYLPGEEVTLTVETKDHWGKSVPAEVSLAVADLSVLALKGNPKKNPTVFFYDGFPLSVTTESNIKNILHEVDIPLGTKGGGGADPDDLAKKKRGVFKDTAFWEASVRTDQTGKATVTFTLPDNLTTWQVEGLGITKDTKLGVDYSEFTTKKDLMAVPLKPRFVVPGDTFSLGAKVFNQTDKDAKVKVELESDTLVFTDSQEESVSIDAGESKTVYFNVVAPKDMTRGTHVFTFTARDNMFVDSVEQTIPITPNTTYETVATANFTKADAATEYVYIPEIVVPDEGGLTINANATLAVFMSSGLSSLLRYYEHGGMWSRISVLGSIGVIKKAFNIENVEGSFDTFTYGDETYNVNEIVEENLKEVYAHQDSSGGFKYFDTHDPSRHLTLDAIEAMQNLKEAGFEIREGVIEKAIAYVEDDIMHDYEERKKHGGTVSADTVINAEYILQQANGGQRTKFSFIIDEHLQDEVYINEKISTTELAYLSILTTNGYNKHDRDRVYELLQNRIDMDGRGAYLKANPEAYRWYRESPVQSTALLLKSFVAHEDEHTSMGNTLRWLLASRDKDGAWGGTQNTFLVVDAMTDYLLWQRENEAHFTLRGFFKGAEIFKTEFNPKTVFDTFTHFMPIADIEKGKVLPLQFKREKIADQDTNFYYDIALKYFLPVDQLPPRDEGITVERALYALDDEDEETPIHTAKVGDVVKGKITITVPMEYEHVSIEDMIPAGFEIINFRLATENRAAIENVNNSEGIGQAEDEGIFARIARSLSGSQTAQVWNMTRRYLGGSYGNTSRKLYPQYTEMYDDRVSLYTYRLHGGVYEYEYFLRALVPGTFQYLPARAEDVYFPEVFGRTSGSIFTITE